MKRNINDLLGPSNIEDEGQEDKVMAIIKRAEIRPNPGVECDANGRCEDTDEVVGYGSLHVEQMNDKCFWARLELPDGKAIVMWFTSRGKITLTAERE